MAHSVKTSIFHVGRVMYCLKVKEETTKPKRPARPSETTEGRIAEQLTPTFDSPTKCPDPVDGVNVDPHPLGNVGLGRAKDGGERGASDRVEEGDREVQPEPLVVVGHTGGGSDS